MTEIISFIPTRIKNATQGGYVAGCNDIIDDALGKEQSQINQEVVGDSATSMKNKLNSIEGQFEVSGGSAVITADPNDMTVGSEKIPTGNAVAGAIEAGTSFHSGENLGGVDIATEISENNNGLAKSGDVYEGLEDIREKIPAQASSSNQLADKDFVNSSIATATATFRGTFNLISDLNLTTSATQGQIATALNTEVTTKDSNDYCFVQIPTSDGTPTEIARIDRYKYNGASFIFEYSLNNSGFTAAQWAAINSNITSDKVSKLDALPTNPDLQSTLGLKEDKANKKTTINNSSTDIDYPTALAVYVFVTGRISTDIAAVKAWAENIFVVKGSYSENTRVGLADNLYSSTEIDDTFLERPTATVVQETADEAYEVANGLSYISGVKGNAAAWNQLVTGLAYALNQRAVKTETETETTITWLTSSNVRAVGWNTLELIAGHKYLIVIEAKNNYNGEGEKPTFRFSTSTSSTYANLFFSSYGVYEKFERIITVSTGYTVNAGSSGCMLNTFDSENPQSITFKKNQLVNYIDLTLLFGAAIADTMTVEKFEFWLKKNVGLKPYYGSNAGTLLGAQWRGVSVLKTPNLLDPETKTARLFVYTYEDAVNKYTIVNAPAGATLYFTPDDTGVESEITMDDETHFSVSGDGTFRIDTNDSVADTWLVAYYDGSIDDYDNFEPYAVYTNNLDARYIYYDDNGTKKKVWSDGVIKATGQGSDATKDSLVLNKNTEKWEAVIKVGDQDLGAEDISWTKYDVTQGALFRTTNIDRAYNTDPAKLCCAKYATTSMTDRTDKTISGASMYANVDIIDNNYSDATTFKAAMSGVHLWYELATPVAYDTLYYSTDGVTFVEMTANNFPNGFVCNNWATEKALVSDYDNGSPTSLAPSMEMEYQADAVETLNTHSDEIADMKEHKADKDEVEELENKKANTEGEYERLHVGLADNLASEITVPSASEGIGAGQFAIRPTATAMNMPASDTAYEVASGQSVLNKIAGSGVAMNQQISYLSGTGVTSSNNEYTVTSAGGNNAARNAVINPGDGINGHLYFMMCDYKASTTITLGVYVSGDNVELTATENYTHIIHVYKADYYLREWFVTFKGTSTTSDTAVFKNMVLIDLTILFGSEANIAHKLVGPTASTITNSNRATAADNFERWLKQQGLERPYIPAMQTLLGAHLTGHKNVLSETLLNPTTKTAELFSYEYEGGGTTVANKYTVTGIPTGATLMFTPFATGVEAAVTMDDASHFTIPGDGILRVDTNADVADMRVFAYYDGSLDEEELGGYREEVQQMDTANIYYDDNGTKVKVWADGVMKATGPNGDDIRDLLMLNKETGKWEAEVMVGDKDFKDLPWAKNTQEKYNCFAAGIEGRKQSPNIKGICGRYAKNDIYNTDNDKCWFFWSGINIFFRDSSYWSGTIDEMKTALSGVHLFYELATPITHSTLYYSTDGETFVEMTSENFPDLMLCNNWAYEKNLISPDDENSVPTSITPCIEVNYNADAVEEMKTMKDDIEGLKETKTDEGDVLTLIRANEDALLSALQSAGVITSYTLAATDTDGVFAVSVTQ